MKQLSKSKKYGHVDSIFTTVLVIDLEHIEELKVTFETWRKYKPEIVSAPIIIVYDYLQIDLNDSFIKTLINNYNVTMYPWNPPVGIYESQREKMLTSYFYAISKVKTKYYLKIDTDCIALNSDKGWLTETTFNGDVFITNPWGYSKPSNLIETMDNWADTKSQFKNTSRLNLPYNEMDKSIKHSRIISWFYFGLTEWTNNMSSICLEGGDYKLPFPSQDTYMWYCATRFNCNYTTMKYKKYGLTHKRGIKNIKKMCT